MITNIVETDTSEASSYFSAYSLIWTVLMGVLPALLVFKVKFQPLKGNWLRFTLTKIVSMLASLVIIAVIAGLYYQDYASVGRNNSYLKKIIIPTQYVYAISSYVKETYLTTPQPYREIGTDAKQSQLALEQAKEKPTLVVFVLGETARTQNYSKSTVTIAKPTHTPAS